MRFAWENVLEMNSACICVLVMSDSVTPWTVPWLAPLPMEFSRQEYWSGLLFPSPGDLEGSQGSILHLLHCRQILYHLSHQGSSLFTAAFLAAAAAAKSLQLCPTLCDPIDGSPPGSPIPGILQARTLEWVAISFSNAWKWKVKVKSLSRVWLLSDPMDCSPPGSSIHGIFQPTVLEWGAIAFSPFWLKECQTLLSFNKCILWGGTD